jgi:CubicO group peptidase (beta-lactamase class C family)
VRLVFFSSLAWILIAGCTPQESAGDGGDSGTQSQDGGNAVGDAGSVGPDAGDFPLDAGPIADASQPTDAGSALLDAATGMDAGCDSILAANALTAALTAATSEVDFSLLLRTQSGRDFNYNRGASTGQTLYESASTSKWVAALAILRLVDTGVLSLSDNPQDHIPFWSADGGSPISDITLEQLLSFTSGLKEEALCQNLGIANFENCVSTLYDNNLAMPVTPGTEYHYGPVHLQVAGLMAVKAAGKASWGEVFADFQIATGLFPSGAFDLPSAGNPRLAGGMHWTGEEYLDFLEAVADQTILSGGLSQTLHDDRINGLPISSSPATGLGVDWHYALGHWIECDSPTFDCTVEPRLSSPGAYGAYPFIDQASRYVGLLARQGALGSFANGLDTYDQVSAEVEAWARCE